MLQHADSGSAFATSTLRPDGSSDRPRARQELRDHTFHLTDASSPHPETIREEQSRAIAIPTRNLLPAQPDSLGFNQTGLELSDLVNRGMGQANRLGQQLARYQQPRESIFQWAEKHYEQFIDFCRDKIPSGLGLFPFLIVTITGAIACMLLSVPWTIAAYSLSSFRTWCSRRIASGFQLQRGSLLQAASGNLHEVPSDRLVGLCTEMLDEMPIEHDETRLSFLAAGLNHAFVHAARRLALQQMESADFSYLAGRSRNIIDRHHARFDILQVAEDKLVEDVALYSGSIEPWIAMNHFPERLREVDITWHASALLAPRIRARSLFLLQDPQSDTTRSLVDWARQHVESGSPGSRAYWSWLCETSQIAVDTSPSVNTPEAEQPRNPSSQGDVDPELTHMRAKFSDWGKI
jgi:hypothetical protein